MWLKLDDQRLGHDKLVAAGPMAELLDVRGMLYAAQRETDGFIPRHQLRLISYGIPAPSRRAAELVRVGRWSEDFDGNGWWIHDFLEYNPSHEEREAERKAARERMARVRERKAKRSGEPTPELQPQFEGKFARSSDYPVPDPVLPNGSTPPPSEEGEPPAATGQPTRGMREWAMELQAMGVKVDPKLPRGEQYRRLVHAGLGELQDHQVKRSKVLMALGSYARELGAPLTEAERGHLSGIITNLGPADAFDAFLQAITSGAGQGEHSGEKARSAYVQAILQNAGKGRKR